MEDKSVKESVVAKYDPTKHYKWEPDSVFAFSGEEYGVILNSLRNILVSPEAKLVKLAQKATEGMENALIRAVEVGVAKEFTPPTKQ